MRWRFNNPTTTETAAIYLACLFNLAPRHRITIQQNQRITKKQLEVHICLNFCKLLPIFIKKLCCINLVFFRYIYIKKGYCIYVSKSIIVWKVFCLAYSQHKRYFLFSGQIMHIVDNNQKPKLVTHFVINGISTWYELYLNDTLILMPVIPSAVMTLPFYLFNKIKNSNAAASLRRY